MSVEDEGIVMPVSVNEWRVRVHPDDSLTYERSNPHPPLSLRDKWLLNVFALQWIKDRNAKAKAIEVKRAFNTPVECIDPDYVPLASNFKVEVEEQYPYGKNRGIINYRGSIHKISGVMYDVDVEFARTHLRKPGWNMEYQGGFIKVNGSKDSTD